MLAHATRDNCLGESKNDKFVLILLEEFTLLYQREHIGSTSDVFKVQLH